MAWHDRDYNRYEQGSGMAMGQRLRTRSINFWLIVACVGIFVLDALSGPVRAAGPRIGRLEQWGFFSADAALFHVQVWRFISYQFFHANGMHLLFNMITLYFFGPLMESSLGSPRYLAFYLLCGIGAAILYLALLGLGMLLPPAALEHASFLLFADPRSPLVGASGSIFGVMVGGAVVAPRTRVSLFFLPIYMSLRTMVYIFLGLAAFVFLTGERNAGGELAHLGGAAMGFLLIRNQRLLGFADMSFGGLSHKVSKSWRDRQRTQVRRRIEAEEAEVDRILAKVKDHGLHSLSNSEKRTLQQATERQRHAG